ncbi:MAG: motility associated factor glycosyltransferase family protein [Treponema sp.]|nr:motility associated factor glycosyltransferase family protein [Treponema sp.]
MDSEYSYSQIIEAKDGSKIPLCRNSSGGSECSLHSKYNPVREAEAFSQTVDSECLFFVVLGLSGGYHIEKIIEKCPKAKILAVEISEAAIDFLSQIPCVKTIMRNRRVIVSDIKSIKEKLLSSYKPAVHGNLTILSLRQWESLFPDKAAEAREKITETIRLLASDYSVQSHFGLIWQKNIFNNLSMAEKAKSFQKLHADTKKTAAIIAAGPSLCEHISELRENRQKYFIIATDTAWSALNKEKIISDAVVSIDGQMISHQHFIEEIPEETLFVFDLCANSCAARKVLEKTGNLVFVESGHPLAQYASLYAGRPTFAHVDSGSGTVTIAAANFARSLGFQNDRITFFGADFSYLGGRPYARGTYLEGQFHSKSTRLAGADNFYSRLMYRTPTIRLSQDSITTEILQAYKNSLKEFMESKNLNSNAGRNFGLFNFKDFKSNYYKDLSKTFRSEDNIDEASPAFLTLLPLCAKLGKGSAFLAYLKVLRYTERV